MEHVKRFWRGPTGSTEAPEASLSTTQYYEPNSQEESFASEGSDARDMSLVSAGSGVTGSPVQPQQVPVLSMGWQGAPPTSSGHGESEAPTDAEPSTTSTTSVRWGAGPCMPPRLPIGTLPRAATGTTTGVVSIVPSIAPVSPPAGRNASELKIIPSGKFANQSMKFYEYQDWAEVNRKAGNMNVDQRMWKSRGMMRVHYPEPFEIDPTGVNFEPTIVCPKCTRKICRIGCQFGEVSTRQRQLKHDRETYYQKVLVSRGLALYARGGCGRLQKWNDMRWCRDCALPRCSVGEGNCCEKACDHKRQHPFFQ